MKFPDGWSRGPVPPGQVEQTLAILTPYPGVNDRWRTPQNRVPGGYADTSYATSTTPTPDALERRLFGPGREERWAEEDAAAEAALVAEIEAERVAAASNALTDDEYRALFGDDH